MKIQFGKRYRFTVFELADLSGAKMTTLRSQISRLAQKGVIKHVDTLAPSNVKVYEAVVDPLTLINQGTMPVHPEYKPESTYFNNPFNMTNAIDWRNRYEEIFN